MKADFQTSVKIIMTPHAKVVKLNSEKKESYKSQNDLPYEKFQINS